MTRPWLALIGVGEDGIEGLSARARRLIEEAALVVGGRRHLGLVGPLIQGERMAWPSPMHLGYPAILACAGRDVDVVVLASGDPYCYGVGNALAGLVPVAETLCLPAPSAFSLACSRLGWALQDTAQVSFCGRPLEGVIPVLQRGGRVLALSADGSTPAALAALLVARGFGASVLHVMEALGGPWERVRRCLAGDGVPGEIDKLNLVAIEVAREVSGEGAVPRVAGLPDAWFEHDGQLTKREIRAVTLSALAPGAGETLWDVGAGAGSIAIEWCLAGQDAAAIAVEVQSARAERAARNARALGAIGVRVVHGEAPAALAGQPVPDAAFIGGGLQRDGVFDAVWAALRPGGRLVANAVALDTQAALFALQARLGGTLTRIAVERLDQVGTMRALRPALAVVQWQVSKPWAP